jgi:hypothetical protein
MMIPEPEALYPKAMELLHLTLPVSERDSLSCTMILA